MKYKRCIKFNWFTTMGGIAQALMYIKAGPASCINNRWEFTN